MKFISFFADFYGCSIVIFPYIVALNDAVMLAAAISIRGLGAAGTGGIDDSAIR